MRHRAIPPPNEPVTFSLRATEIRILPRGLSTGSRNCASKTSPGGPKGPPNPGTPPCLVIFESRRKPTLLPISTF